MGVVFPRQQAQQREARAAFKMALALAGTPSAAKDLGILAIHFTPAGRGRPASTSSGSSAARKTWSCVRSGARATPSG